MTKDDQRVRETVQAELRRRRGALDRSEEERPERAGCQGLRGMRGPGMTNGHVSRPQGGERREPLRRIWPAPTPSPSGTTSE
jgi:hypothetical protein